MRLLLSDPEFTSLDLGAKMIYSMLLTRLGLSEKNAVLFIIKISVI